MLDRLFVLSSSPPRVLTLTSYVPSLPTCVLSKAQLPRKPHFVYSLFAADKSMTSSDWFHDKHKIQKLQHTAPRYSYCSECLCDGMRLNYRVERSAVGARQEVEKGVRVVTSAILYGHLSCFLCFECCVFMQTFSWVSRSIRVCIYVKS
jgi:hypothetical protein